MDCVYCQEKVGKYYRVDEQYHYFCDDECYENFFQEGDCFSNDHLHPYIDDYENIRSEFIYYDSEWKDRLTFAKRYLDEVHTMIDDMDAFISDYYEFYYSDGDDGIFHYEMKRLLEEIAHLQKEIIQWRPNKVVSYTVYLKMNERADVKDIVFYRDMLAYLKKFDSQCGKDKNKDFSLLYNGYDEATAFKRTNYDMWFTYDTAEEAKEVIQICKVLFKKIIKSITMLESDKCHCGCDSFLPFNWAENIDGWHYGEHCAFEFSPGEFSKEQLSEKVALSVDDVLEAYSYHELKWFVAKVKRSCIVNEVDYPDWILLADQKMHSIVDSMLKRKESFDSLQHSQ